MFYALFIRCHGAWNYDSGSYSKNEALRLFGNDSAPLRDRRLVTIESDSDNQLRLASIFLQSRNTKNFIDLT